MRHILFLTLLLSFIIIKSNAQNDFREGYIIKNNNDTVFGLIDYRGNLANSKLCVFKEQEGTPKTEYTPEEIQAYRFANSKYYVSKKLNYRENQENLFLEYLINGIVDIYYFRDNLGEHYLIDDGSGRLTPLKNEKKEVFVNNSRYLKESKEYIRILKYIFRESSTISKKAENVQLGHKSLISIASDYHNEVCFDEECIVYEKKLPQINTKVGILLGINAITANTRDEFADDVYYLNYSDFNIDIYPALGMFIKTNLPYINERMYFQYEITYSRWNLETYNSFTEPIYSVQFLNDISFTQNALNNSFNFKYEYPNRKFRRTLQAGIFIDYLFKINYQRDLEALYSWGNTFLTEEFKNEPFSKLNYGISVGAGLITELNNGKEIFLDLKYQYGIGLIRNLTTNTISLNLGLVIGK